MAVTSSGEVAAYVDETQFQDGHSQMKCGFYAFWQNHYAGRPGSVPSGTSADIQRQADASYIKDDGADVAGNENGISLAQLYALFTDTNDHWQNIFPDALPSISAGNLKAFIRQWSALGYPCIVAVDEGSIYDMDLRANPYAWKPKPGQYSHIITISGIQPNSIDFLCRDTANIGPTGIRPGPRKYAATPMTLASATLFVPPWLSRPTSAIPPMAPTTPTPVTTDWKKMAMDAVDALNTALPHLSN